MASLVLVGVEPSRRLALGDALCIGRDEGCALRIEDPLVGRRHAEIRPTAEGGYEIVDLGSRCGTFVRDRRVSAQRLQHGDEILIGPTRLRFEDPAAVPELDPRAWPRRAGDRASQAAFELATALEKAADLPAMLEALLRTALNVACAERGAVQITDDEPFSRLQVARNRDGTPAEVTLSSSLLSEVVARGEGVVTANVAGDPRLHGATSLVAQRVRSAMCVPLVHRGERLGVLHLDSQLGDAFDDTHLEIVSAMARQASVAIRSALLALKVESAAAAERQRLHRLLADLPAGVILVERDGRIAFANPLGLELAGALGAPAGAEVLERLGALTLGQVLAAPEPVELAAAAGPRRIVLASAREASGGVLVVLRDVTLEREREARVGQQERLALMGQLAAGVAHDFNNVLSVICNFTQFVLDELVEQRHRDDLQEVLGAANRAAQMVRQLLAFGSREVMRPQVVRLDRVVTAMDRLVRGAVGERVEVRTAFAPDLWRVKVDPSMLGQVVLNLAVNARDAMPGGGTLAIQASNRELGERESRQEGLPAGRYAVLEVTDTGVGMPEHVARRVFEPFFTTKPAGKGSGLGLATSYGIVRQTGGTISLRTREGSGTTFSVFLPATDDADAEGAGARVQVQGSGETVLVVEDEHLVRDLTRRILTEAGYRVLVAGSGPEALELARRHQGTVELLLTDMVMPGMTGKQLALQLAAERPGIRTLYMSGYFDEQVGNGVHGTFVAKPFNRETLLERVGAALAGR